ncbi:MAG: hypothetical protein ACRC8C_01030 [Mycoplasmoidaceae bacterium]
MFKITYKWYRAKIISDDDNFYNSLRLHINDTAPKYNINYNYSKMSLRLHINDTAPKYTL